MNIAGVLIMVGVLLFMAGLAAVVIHILIDIFKHREKASEKSFSRQTRAR